MEDKDKKRRPRIAKSDSAPESTDRGDNDTPNNQNEGDFSERKPYSDRPNYQDREGGGGGYERKPYGDRPNYQNREGGGGGYERKPYGDRPNYQNREGGGGGYERKPYGDRPNYQNREGGGGGYERKPYGDRPNYQNREGGGGGGYERKPYGDRPNYQNREGGGGGGYERKPYGDRPNYQNREGGGGGGYERKPYGDRPNYQNREGGGGGGYERKPYGDRPNYQNREGGGGGGYERKPYGDRPNYQNREGGGGGGYERRPYGGGGGGKFNNRGGGGGGFKKKPMRKKDDFYIELKPKADFPTGEGMPLNKYLAHCGIASRRKAVELIEGGNVLVNGEPKTEPYYRIQAGDMVTCDGQPLKVQEKMVYVLLNKPKNVITSTEDERGRYTVLDIVDPHYPERIYPVGRLDRDTTGLLLLTNDGDLAQKLMHPSYRIQKQYRVGLRRPLEAADMELIRTGVKLEDGVVEVNWIRFSEEHPEGDIVELEITSGRNRVIRRLFEALDYEVFKLDRFYFAGLTKKDLARGSFRDLTPREIIMLKHFTGHPSTTKKMLDTNQTDDDAIDVDDDVEGDDFVEEGDKD